MEKIKVLFIDDDINLGQVVTLALKDAGYEVYYQTSLTAIHSIISEIIPDIIVLDVEIGNKNGIEVAPELKSIAPKIPILFISSHVESSNVAKALDAGGIAYLKKPFDIEELLAYISRHTSNYQPKGLNIGQFTLIAEDNLLMKNEQIIKKLSLFECKLLKLFALNPNRTITREQIEQELWNGEGYSSEQSLNNYIAKLRKYIQDDKTIGLTTIPKVGYKLSISE
jgi:Response regulators consisting of a CheY-like receiver domain and a winged-helix DNA-binding domain